MLTFINFVPLASRLKSFAFILHPHLRRSNIIDDDLLKLDHYLDDEARVQLHGVAPAIWSTRFDLGIYLNHQLLNASPVILHDGDIIAFPPRRHDLKAAVRFRVEVEELALSCGENLELDMVRLMAQEMREENARGLDPGPSSKPAPPDSASTHAGTPATFSYAELVTSRVSPPLSPPSSNLAPASSGLASSSSNTAMGSHTTTTAPRAALPAPSPSPLPSSSSTSTASSPPPSLTTSSRSPPQPAACTVSPIGDGALSAEISSIHPTAVLSEAVVMPNSSMNIQPHVPLKVDALSVALQRVRQGWIDARRALFSQAASSSPPCPTSASSTLPSSPSASPGSSLSTAALFPRTTAVCDVQSVRTLPHCQHASSVTSADVALMRVQQAWIELRRSALGVKTDSSTHGESLPRLDLPDLGVTHLPATPVQPSSLEMAAVQTPPSSNGPGLPFLSFNLMPTPPYHSFTPPPPSHPGFAVFAHQLALAVHSTLSQPCLRLCRSLSFPVSFSSLSP
ncbi:hypothetical protein A4X13_0g4300 [Tilletia indica]|uniref:FHA domain-containing protein n=1 Tax=Tilletia indica TaxID=43049 RepID=A0A177TSC6_9BASI|nr:hypothetical protein A4X13_0g4300 [Tilletia indica]